MRPFLLLSLLAAACSNSSSDGEPAARVPQTASPATAVKAAPPEAAVPAVPTPDAAPPLAGRDFAAEAAVLYRVVACAGDQPLPAHIDAAIIEGHCRRIAPRISKYRDGYGATMAAFLAGLHPADLPDVVVYPFGGGDLLSALVAYPGAREITTLSLEQAGDPRRIATLGGAALSDDLGELRTELGGLLSVGSNTSKNLMAQQQNELPGQLSSFLVALAVFGHQPVNVRYFRIEPDGALHYYTEPEIAALDAEEAGRLKHDWVDPNFSPAFKNVEIRYRAAGAGPEAPLRVHRHIGANLADGPLEDQPGLLRYLDDRGGRIAALVKGASYLLWRPDFSTIREYLLDRSAYLIADSTGVPPRFVPADELRVYTFGRFTGSFLDASEAINDEMKALWKKQPSRKMPHRFGYVDANKMAHMMITVRKELTLPDGFPRPWLQAHSGSQ